jgi:hypothetical protein
LVATVGEDCCPELVAMLSNQPEARFVSKPRNELDPLWILPKKLGILKINPVLSVVGLVVLTVFESRMGLCGNRELL